MLNLEDVYKLQILYKIDNDCNQTLFSGFITKRIREKAEPYSFPPYEPYVYVNKNRVGKFTNFETFYDNPNISKVTGYLYNNVCITFNTTESIYILKPLLDFHPGIADYFKLIA